MIKSKAELRREVAKKASEYSAEDIFSSPYFEELIQSLVTGQCHTLGRVPKLHASYQADSDFTACTEGENIYLNTASPNIRDLETLWEKYLANVGLATHEVGHVLFTDFVNLNKLVQGWKKPHDFRWYPSTPVGGTPIKKYLDSHPNFANEFIKGLCHLQNIEEDVYIENCDYQEFGGICTAGLNLLNRESYKKCSPEDTLYNKVLNGELSMLSVALNFLLVKKFGYEVKTAKHLTDEQLEVKEKIKTALDLAKQYIDQLAWESNGLTRCKLLNEVAVCLFPLLPQKDNDEDYDSNESNQRQENEEQQLGNSGNSQMPTGNTRPVDTESLDEEEVADQKQTAHDLANSERSMQQALEQAVKEIAKQEVIENDERQHARELEKEASQIEKEIGKSYFSGYTFDRVKPQSDTLYNSVFKGVKPTADNLYRKLSNILKERQTEGYDSGYMMGQRFNATDVYHGDGKYFSREIVPDAQPNVSFGILIDESGSMHGEKATNARKIAMLLEDVLRRLKVPLMIVGHDEEQNDCIIHSYVDFDTSDGRDKNRLVSVTARYGNIDGAAITYVGEKLLRRPEEIKVMIVISDGLPAGVSFYDKRSSDTDTKLAIQKYRKQGLKVFGAIVDDFSRIAKLYDEQYSFNCMDMHSLEKEMCRIVKKYVLIR